MTRFQRRGRRGGGLVVDPERLRLARVRAGLTQAQLAGEELSRQAVSQFELGQSQPSLEALEYIAERTACSLEWFIFGKEKQDGS